MTRAAAVRGPARRVAGGGRPAGLAAGAGLWLAAALISGFTAPRLLDPFDEGLLLVAVDRILAGQWLYADFGWAYGPGHPLVLSAAAELLGPSVVWWRVLRTAADATVALLVFLLVDRAAGRRWALAAGLAAALTMAQPTSANPFPVAFAFGLGALLAAVRGRPVAAGVLVALAAAWRIDFGLVAAVAVLVAGRERRTAAAVAVGGTAVVYLPFAIAAGPAGLWDALAGGSLDEGRAWRLPFPLLYDGPLRAWPPQDLLTDLKDLIGYELPLVATIGLAGGAVALLARRRRDPVAAGLLVLALGGLAYLLSRADEFHQQPLVVAVAALVAAVAAVAPRPAAALLAFVILAGAANRISALALPPDLEPVHLPGVPGIRVPPSEADALPRMVATVQRLVPPGEPIYVAPRRSDLVTFNAPLVHFLTRRPNVLDQDALLQATPEAQARIVDALRRERPVVVRWTDPLSARPEPNPRGRPSGSRRLDAYLSTAYRRHSRFGVYEVLIPA